jgi:hypothetical protein
MDWFRFLSSRKRINIEWHGQAREFFSRNYPAARKETTTDDGVARVLSVGINRWDAASTPTGFAEILSDDFPILHGCRKTSYLLTD